MIVVAGDCDCESLTITFCVSSFLKCLVLMKLHISSISGMHRPLEGQGLNGVTRAQSRTWGVVPPRLGDITIHNFITILCHVGFSILQAV